MLYHQILSVLVLIMALSGALVGCLTLAALGGERRAATKRGGSALRAWKADALTTTAVFVAVAVALVVWAIALGAV